MEILEIINTLIAFGSLIVAIIALIKANEAKKMIDKSNKTEQSINSSKISNSHVVQTGHDNKGKE